MVLLRVKSFKHRVGDENTDRSNVGGLESANVDFWNVLFVVVG